MGIATAVRAAIPLGLMKNVSGPTMAMTMKPGTSLLPPPIGDWDREERRVLMFTVLMFDINASSSSGWPNMMMTDELVSPPEVAGQHKRQPDCTGSELTNSIRNYHVPDLTGNHLYVDSYRSGYTDKRAK